MTAWQVIEGDCRDVLATLPDQSVHTVVTSPPYFGLRDYQTGRWEGGDPACDHLADASGPAVSGLAGYTSEDVKIRTFSMPQGQTCGRCGATRVDQQIGLEPTPDDFVAALVQVFRDVRRVLRDDGTVWLNLGSSYASEDGYPIKPTDAAWLAGLIDGEGCIQIHQQRGRPNCRDQFQLDLSVGMMTREAVERAYAITGLGSCGQQNRGVWDWSVRGRQTAELLRALFPYLVTKRRQAALGIMLLDHVAEQRGNRVRPLTDEAVAYREALKRSVSACNQRGEPEITPRDPRPVALCVKAKDDLMIPHRAYRALMDDGWYGRSDIVWSKANPMPESVTDRPTKAHEFLFLLSKSGRYFYDHDAIREDWADEREGAPGGRRPAERNRGGRTDGYTTPPLTWTAPEGRTGRNRRSVWTVATQPFSAKSLGISRRVRVAPDAADDDTTRIASPDCPVHGDRPAPAATAPDGGRADGSPSRTADNNARRAQAQPDGRAPTGPPHAPDCADDSPGSLRPGRSPAATPRSNGSRRTDPAPATKSPCTPCEGTAPRTVGTSTSPESAEPRASTPESSSGPVGSAARPEPQTGDGTARTSSGPGVGACTCEHYRLEPIDHFATFPPKLIEPCVLAGAPERACGECGAPWVRVVEREAMEVRPGPSRDARRAAAGDAAESRRAINGTMTKPPSSRTVGFEPSCECGADPAPGVVLDPFCGAGTTGMVALRHGRSFVGVELNPTYAEMARERIRDDAPLFNTGAEVAA